VIGRVESIERDGREVSSRISFRQSVVGFILRRSRRAIWHYMRAANWMRRFERGGSAEPGIPQALG
jgi:hypothetical protein